MNKKINNTNKESDTNVSMEIYTKDDGFTLSAINAEQEDGSVVIQITADYKGRTMQFSSEKSVLYKKIDKICNCGADIGPVDIMCILKAVGEVNESLPVIPYVKGRGWQFDRAGQVKGYSGVYNYNLKCEKLLKNEYLPSSTTKGSWEKLKPDLEQYLTKNVKRSALFLISLSAILCGYLRKNIVTAVVGSSSTGKTTIAKIGQSIFSDIKDDYLTKTFSGTENYIVQTMRNINGIAVLIDDTSLCKDKDFDCLLYQLSDGKERGRLSKGAVPQDRASWATSTMITAEKSVLFSGNLDLEGKAGRTFEISVSDDELFDSSEQAEHMLKLVTENYGIIEPMFVEYLIKNDVLSSINELHQIEIDKARSLNLDNDKIVNRLCNNIATVTLTAEIAQKVLGIEFDIDCVRKYLVNVCIDNLKSYRDSNDTNTKFGIAYDILIERAKTEGEYKDGYYIISTEVFKNIYKSNCKDFCMIREWKLWLKEHNCLYVNDGDFRYRTSSFRGYAIREQVIDNA